MALWRGCRPSCLRKSVAAAVAVSAGLSFSLPLTLREASSRVIARPFSSLHAPPLMFRKELLNRSGTCSWDSSSIHSVGMNGDNVPAYFIEERGSLFTMDYRVFFKDQSGYISPWHDVPLYANEANKIFNMIVEIPRWTNAKMEMATKEPMSPIRQDIKKGVPRFVDNVFPHHGYIWNYGALPQTWEDPNHIDAETKAKGDNDPIDVIEIGSKIHRRGDIVQVKILGTIALIDEGETDWKLVAVDVKDPAAEHLNSITDVDKLFPGLLKATHEWFRVYKIPTGKPANAFGFNGEFKDQEFAHKIILETHDFWKKLVKNPSPAPLNTECRQSNAAFPASQEEWLKEVESRPVAGTPSVAPTTLDRWHFISE